MVSRKKLFLDFDGTLIDSSRRLYTLFTQLSSVDVSYDQYWQLKREGITQRDLLQRYFGFSAAQCDYFKAQWMEGVEKPGLLVMDYPILGASAFLQRAVTKYDLYLVTARQHPGHVTQQLQLFGWETYFQQVFVTQQRCSKADLVRSTLVCKPDDMFVGDTGEDIRAGKELGVITIAVSSGFIKASLLACYEPDYILGSVVELRI